MYTYTQHGVNVLNGVEEHFKWHNMIALIQQQIIL